MSVDCQFVHEFCYIQHVTHMAGFFCHLRNIVHKEELFINKSKQEYNAWNSKHCN